MRYTQGPTTLVITNLPTRFSLLTLNFLPVPLSWDQPFNTRDSEIDFKFNGPHKHIVIPRQIQKMQVGSSWQQIPKWPTCRVSVWIVHIALLILNERLWHFPPLIVCLEVETGIRVFLRDLLSTAGLGDRNLLLLSGGCQSLKILAFN